MTSHIIRRLSSPSIRVRSTWCQRCPSSNSPTHRSTMHTTIVIWMCHLRTTASNRPSMLNWCSMRRVGSPTHLTGRKKMPTTMNWARLKKKSSNLHRSRNTGKYLTSCLSSVMQMVSMSKILSRKCVRRKSSQSRVSRPHPLSSIWKLNTHSKNSTSSSWRRWTTLMNRKLRQRRTQFSMAVALLN